MQPRSLHVVHLLIRQKLDGQVGYLVYPHKTWIDEKTQQPYLALPAKKTVEDPLAELIQDTPLDENVDAIMFQEIGLLPDAYALDQELRAAHVRMHSPTRKDKHGQAIMTHYMVYPIDVWVRPEHREVARNQLNG